ncbi:PRC-barrel domain-containing protein [Rhodanobacter sp. 7MK24]|uniref:PRC-barrel domain-containing protein n=1 Tax=Rhodanobacter sp. 7MK24 TaxID=2775922 RepID=UPI00177EDCBB|nr:PRC-barrel domain-containing protein [Rhodanobacter sp. 7MK24]MBD8882339.1 PRC-barrel domain-containing protein [Rhodanobacter sp. 7MK24]
MTNTSTQFLSASTLTGDKVKNLNNEALGELKDIMIDTQSGEVSYGVLSYGGVLGIGDKLFAVPWDALTVDGENKCLILNVNKDRLESAPGFDKDHWPDFADPGFEDRVRQYYSQL